MSSLLNVSDLEVSYGSITALHGINLEVNRGQIVTLIGANGAGKTTTLRTISGLLKPRKGEVSYDNRSITGRKPHVITAMGISHVPEGRGIFANLTVADNLDLGAYLRKDKVKQSEYERIFTLFPVLKERIKQSAGTLSGGEQQMLAISRALMAKPQLLLLDEHTAALDPTSADQVIRLSEELIAHDQLTTLMVTHSMQQAVNLGDRLIMMHRGRIIHDLHGAEKRRLRVDDLLARFEEVRRGELLDETAAEMLRRAYV